MVLFFLEKTLLDGAFFMETVTIKFNIISVH